MAVSSFFLLDEPDTPVRNEPECEPGEGRESELARRATAALLWPEGRPGAWLLFTAGACFAVLLSAALG
jgi:hypothetical protein